MSDLSQRMRRFASDTLSAQDITLHFHAPQQELHLDAEVRRQVFLIFKECINNIAPRQRHRCRSRVHDARSSFVVTDQRQQARFGTHGAATRPKWRQWFAEYATARGGIGRLPGSKFREWQWHTGAIRSATSSAPEKVNYPAHRHKWRNCFTATDVRQTSVCRAA